MTGQSNQSTLEDKLQEKIKVLHDSIWERRADWPHVSKWLDQFTDSASKEDDRLQALFLLSNFMYFGTNEIRALLKSLYRDVFRPSVIAELRTKHPSLFPVDCARLFLQELKNTRFVSLGNPSESSAFLLYYFRQENSLARECFVGGGEIFTPDAQGNFSLKDPTVTRYVFIDDMCGSGQQGEEYSRNIVVPLKSLFPDVKIYYYALFGTSRGMQRLRDLNKFDTVHTVVELDESFRCFSDNSRIYREVQPPLAQAAGRALVERFGMRLQPKGPLGFQDGQLLLGFAYNTPDNTLPVIWSNGNASQAWTPVFKRYSKLAYS